MNYRINKETKKPDVSAFSASHLQVTMSPGEDGLIGIPFPEHSNELLCHLNDQRRAGLLCDLTLTSRGMRYPTHRSVMAAVSLYFRRLFGAETSISEGLSVCQLDCVAPDALDALLEFAYTATLTIPSSGMRDVLQGAQLLGIQCVADACRDILGETLTAEETEVEQKIVSSPNGQHAERMSHTGGGSTTKASRRKMDKMRMKVLGPHHHLNSSTVNFAPCSPIPSQPSPASDSFLSLPSTQPPSPDPQQQEQGHKLGQNGDQRGIGETLNGGLPHWLYRRPPLAPAAGPPSQDKLSEDDDLEGFVDSNGLRIGGNPTPASTTDPSRVPSTGAGGRKRKSQTPQQCPVCQKIIHGAGKLPRHMRTHTGEKPFQCTACGVRFTR